MPCQSDYLAASGQELESKRVCCLLVYVYEQIGKEIPDWIKTASIYYYGNVARLDEATALLCSVCRSFTSDEKERIIYNAHSKESRNLASWFERHQEWDNRRVAEENEMRQKIMLKERALKKLTTEEMVALGLIEESAT